MIPAGLKRAGPVVAGSREQKRYPSAGSSIVRQAVARMTGRNRRHPSQQITSARLMMFVISTNGEAATYEISYAVSNSGCAGGRHSAQSATRKLWQNMCLEAGGYSTRQSSPREERRVCLFYNSTSGTRNRYR
jgi:hypothetical protein